MSRPERPAPPPLEGNERLITAIITAGWAVALIVLLIVRDQLSAADRWWVWVAAFGTFMGFFGLIYVPHLHRSRTRAEERKRAGRQQDDGGQAEDNRAEHNRTEHNRTEHNRTEDNRTER